MVVVRLVMRHVETNALLKPEKHIPGKTRLDHEVVDVIVGVEPGTDAKNGEEDGDGGDGEDDERRGRVEVGEGNGR